MVTLEVAAERRFSLCRRMSTDLGVAWVVAAPVLPELLRVMQLISVFGGLTLSLAARQTEMRFEKG